MTKLAATHPTYVASNKVKLSVGAWWYNVATQNMRLKPVLNLANVCSPEHTSDISTNYDSLLN